LDEDGWDGGLGRHHLNVTLPHAHLGDCRENRPTPLITAEKRSETGAQAAVQQAGNRWEKGESLGFRLKAITSNSLFGIGDIPSLINPSIAGRFSRYHQPLLPTFDCVASSSSRLLEVLLAVFPG
jgi:hypothetical protein